MPSDINQHALEGAYILGRIIGESVAICLITSALLLPVYLIKEIFFSKRGS